MVILGLHFGHDGGACIVQDGKLLSAIASERLTRIKKSHGFNDATIDYVLSAAGVQASEVDAIAISDYHPKYGEGVEVRCEQDTWNQIFGNEVRQFEVGFRGRLLPGYNPGHHLCHCAAAYYTSPYDESYCMSMDASGGWPKANYLVAHGKGNQLAALDGPSCLTGLAYGQFTEQLGLGPQIYKAGTTMALAGYGEVLPAAINNIEDHIARSLFTEGTDYRAWVEQLWCEIAGRVPFGSHEKDGKHAQDVAASIQYIFEQTILHLANEIPADGCKNICLGGGSFLNCNANTAVLTKSQFENVHLFPAASDDGGCVGAALYVAHAIMNEPRAKYRAQDLCYLGLDRPAAEPDYSLVAERIAGGAVVAWFSGRSEAGPRALGHRSILADPRDVRNRERINNELKKREWFRPLSPSVLAEKSGEWFDFPTDSPFMLFTAPCKHPELIPAAVHIDGTARMQTVTEEANLNYYHLIKRFDELTGVPMVLNTSLNVDGQPILETEADAMEFWERVAVDMMVLNGEVYER